MLKYSLTRLVFLLLLVSVVALHGIPASAQLIPGTVACKWDQNVLPYMSSSVSADDTRGWSIKVCTYSYDGHKEAQLFAAPHRSSNGVCSVPFIDVNLKVVPDGNVLIVDRPKDGFRVNSDWTTPRIEMTKSNDEECPSPSDSRYVVTRQLTDGLFPAFMDLWDRLRTASTSLETKFGYIPQTRRKADPVDFKRLEKIFSDGNLLEKLKPNFVGLGYVPALVDQRGLGFRPMFQISFTDPENRSTFFTLYVDWTPKGFEIVGFGVAIA